MLLQVIEQGCFESAEAEAELSVERVRPVFAGVVESAREAHGVRVATFGEVLNGGPAGIAEAKERCAFVEGFARGVVDGLADDFIVPGLFHVHESCVAAGNQQGKHRKRAFENRRFVAKKNRVDMTFVMVDAHQRFFQPLAERTRRRKANQQRAREAGTIGDGETVEIVKGTIRFGERFLNDTGQFSNVIATGNFRDNAAVGRVLGNL